jgi:hypothetical protein
LLSRRACANDTTGDQADHPPPHFQVTSIRNIMAKSIKHKSRRKSTALLVPEAQQRRSRPVVRRRGATFRQQWKNNQPLSLDDVVQLVDRASESDPGQWSALCPAHADSNPSLSFSENDGKLLLCCHSGCSHKEILAKLKALQAEKFCCGPPSARPAPRVTAEPTSRETKKSRNTRRELPNPTTLKNGSSAKEDFARLAMAFEQAISDVQVSQLAKELNVSPKALRAMHVGRRTQGGTGRAQEHRNGDARPRKPHTGLALAPIRPVAKPPRDSQVPD